MWFQRKKKTNEEAYFEHISGLIEKKALANKQKVGSRIDALLAEKAKAAGVKLPSQHSVNLRKGLVAMLAFSMFMVFALTLWVVKPDLYLPLIRLLAKPTVASVQLQGVTFTDQGVPATTKEIRLVTEKPVNEKFVEPLIKVTPKIDYAVTLSSDKKEIIITPKQNLAEGITYTIELRSGLVFQDGSYLAGQQSWIIPVQPAFAVTGISPASGSKAPFTAAIEVTISRDDFEIDDFKKLFSISPKVDGTFEKRKGSVVFVPSKNLIPETTYTVTVAPGLKTKSGEEMKAGSQSVFSVLSVAESEGGNVINYEGPSLEFPIRIYNTSQGQDNTLLIEGIKSVQLNEFKISEDKVQGIMEQVATKDSVAWESFIKGADKVKTLSISVNSATDYTFKTEDLASGIYILQATDKSGAYVAYQLLLKGTHGIHVVKDSAAEKLHVWAFDYTALNMASGVDIAAFSCTKQNCSSLAADKSPDNGYVTLKGKPDMFYLLTKKADSYSLVAFGDVFNKWTGAQEDQSQNKTDLIAKIRTNKPFYSPGETIKYAMYIRERNGSVLTAPANNREFRVSLCAPEESVERTRFCYTASAIKLNSDGNVTGEIPTVTKRDSFDLVLTETTGGQDKEVATFNVQVFENEKSKYVLDGKIDKDEYLFSEKVVLHGRLTDYAGNGVAGKKISINMSPAIYRVDPDASSPYSIDEFEYANGTSGYNAIEATTDNSGNYAITLPLDSSKLTANTYKFLISAEYHDGNTSSLINKEFIYSRGQDYIVNAQQKGKNVFTADTLSPVTVSLKAVNLYDGVVISKRIASVTIRRKWYEKVKTGTVFNPYTKQADNTYRYDYKTEVVMAPKTLTFSDKGEYFLDIKDPKEGSYEITVSNVGSKGTITTDLFAVNTDSSNSDELTEHVTSLAFTTDSAKVGEKVSLVFADTFKDPKRKMVMITSTDRVISWTFIDATNTSLDFPVTQEMVGAVRVCLAYPVAGVFRSGGSASLIGKAIDDENCAFLKVEDPAQKLTVTVTSDKSTYKPGEKATLSVEVKNSDNQGVPAEVGISVIDKALQGSGRNEDFWSESLYNDFYKQMDGNFPQEVSSANYRLLLSHGIPNFFGMGSGAEQQAALRKNFNDNPYWSGTVKTDANGKASVSVDLPDSITTWVIKSWATGTKTKVGDSYTEITATKDVYLVMDNPQFLRKGDLWTGSVAVFNTTGNAFSGTITATCDTCLDKAAQINVSVPAKSSSQYEIPFNIKDSAATVKLALNNKQSQVDGLESKLNIRSVDFSNSAELLWQASSDKSSVSVDLGANVSKPQSKVTLYASKFPFSDNEILLADPAVASTGSLSGSILSATYAFNNADKLDMNTSSLDLHQRILFQTELLLKRQNDTGGFGWFEYDGADYTASAQAAEALGYIKDNNRDIFDIIPENVYTRLEAYLTSAILADSTSVPDKVTLMRGLAYLNKEKASPFITATFAGKDKLQLTLDDELVLADALLVINARTNSADLVNTIASKKVMVGNDVAYVPLTDKLYGNAILARLQNDLRDAIADPTTLGQVQNWILEQQFTSGTKQFSDYDTALELINSFDPTHFQSFESLSVDVMVNNKAAGKIQYNGTGTEFNIPGDLLQDGSNKIEVKMPQNKLLFITVHSDIVSNAEITEKKANFTIIRNIENLTNPGQPFTVGDIGVVKITVSAATDATNVVVRDYLPAGITSVPIYSDLVSVDFIGNYLKDPKTVAAYGDQKYTDSMDAFMGSIKAQESKTVVYPVMAIRKGIWGNAATQVESINTPEGQSIKRDSILEVK